MEKPGKIKTKSERIIKNRKKKSQKIGEIKRIGKHWKKNKR